MSKTPPLPLLTEVELEMMRVLWERGPSTVQDVLNHLGRKLAYTSVLTMLRILEQKGYARRSTTKDSGRAHVYAPAVAEAAVQRSHLRNLLHRFFDDRPEQLVTGLLDDERLSRRDIERLKALVERRLSQGGSKRGGS